MNFHEYLLFVLIISDNLRAISMNIKFSLSFCTCPVRKEKNYFHE